MNKLLGLDKKESVTLYQMLRNYGAIILFSGIGYFLGAMVLGFIEGETWKYVQSVDKYYVTQGLLLVVALIFQQLIRVILTQKGLDYFFMYPKVDKYFYPIAFILTYLVINEIGGL